MSRRNPFLRTNNDLSSLSYSASRLNPQHMPVRSEFGYTEPEIIYSTPTKVNHLVTRPAPAPLVMPQPKVAHPVYDPFSSTITSSLSNLNSFRTHSPPPQHEVASPIRHDAFVYDPFSPTITSSLSNLNSFRTHPPPPQHEVASPIHHDAFVYDPFSPTIASSLSSLHSSRSSLLELCTPKSNHYVFSPTSPAKTVPTYSGFSTDYDPFTENIWTISDADSRMLRQLACIIDECARATKRMAPSSVSAQDAQDLKKRVVLEFMKYCNGRDGHLSLSEATKGIEDAVANSTTHGTAHIDVSEVHLAQLIREFSPRLTVAEMMSYILAWVGPTNRHARTREEKERRANKFMKMKLDIIQIIKLIWFPTNHEEPGKRFLSRKEYACAASRLYHGEELSDTETVQLLNTVRGLDVLDLLGKCLHHGLATSTDVTLMGETLAKHYLDEGYSFALFTLFKNAGDKICRGNAEMTACWAADQAAYMIWTKKHTYEDHVFHGHLGKMVDEYGGIQRVKFGLGRPRDKPDKRQARIDYKRSILDLPDVSGCLCACDERKSL